MHKLLTIEKLSAEAFSPYGDVIEASEQAQHFLINDGNTMRYHDLMSVELDEQGRPTVSIFRGTPRPLPFAVRMLERHPFGSQAFIPLQGYDYLVVVCLAGDTIAQQDIKAFYCQGNQGVNYRRGVWHHPLLAINHTADFLVIDRSGPGKNCEERNLTEELCLDLAEYQFAKV